MGKYLLKRIIHGLLSVIIVVAIVMILVYTAIDKENIFRQDPLIQKKNSNEKIVYKYQCWEDYGYLDYVPYADWLSEITRAGEIDEPTRAAAVSFGRTAEKDSAIVTEYIAKFTEVYEAKGYTIVRLNADTQSATSTTLKKGGQQRLFAYKNTPLPVRIWNYFKGVISVDNIHYAKGDVGQRKLTFTMNDPAYGGDKFSPAIIGNGTKYKYLLYFDNKFPFIHQNLITINLGLSYSINKGVDVWTTMVQPQGSNVMEETLYPTGFVESSSNDLHTARYAEGSLKTGGGFAQTRFTDDYTIVGTTKSGMSKMGYSFIIGIISALIAYLVGIPLGILMSRNQNKLIDKIGTLYIVFIIAVPSLAYIFMFRAIGMKFGWPTTFTTDPTAGIKVYLLPIISLALPSIGGLMKWTRRYMIDQKNSDYVKFARSGGLSEGEIFRGHILKNAMIYIVHGIPGTILGALIGGIITERVYTVPGTGGMLVNAITAYDNAAIVGLAMFYALLAVASLILGDILMSMVDPRISFSSKGR